MTNIEASNILPYHIDDICKEDRGIDVVEVEGAVIAHVACVDDIMSELKYPCRIEAFVAVLCVRGEVSFSSHLSDYRLTENQLFVASSTTMQFKSSRNAELYIVAFTSDFINDMNLDKRLLLPIFTIHTIFYAEKFPLFFPLSGWEEKFTLVLYVLFATG